MEECYFDDNIQLFKEFDAKIRKVNTYNLMRHVFNWIREFGGMHFSKRIATWLLEKYPQELKTTFEMLLNSTLRRDRRRTNDRVQMQVEKIQEIMMDIIHGYDITEVKIDELEFLIKMDQQGLLPQYIEPSFVQEMIEACGDEYEIEELLRNEYGSLIDEPTKRKRVVFSDSDSDMSDSGSDSDSDSDSDSE